MELRDSVVIVTGAGGGIGREIAAAYAQRGAKLAITDLTEGPLNEIARRVEATASDLLAIPCDITSPEQVGSMMQQVVNGLGPPDILINSAGLLSALGPVWEVDPRRWIRDVSVNLCGTFLVISSAVQHMIPRKRGYVISLVGAGVYHPHLYTTGYDASKAGLVRLTEALATEASEFGIKTFTLCPGAVRTPMTEFILNSPEGRRWRPTFKDIFDRGEDLPPSRTCEWCLALTSGLADSLTGRWFDAADRIEQVIGESSEIVSDNRRVRIALFYSRMCDFGKMYSSPPRPLQSQNPAQTAAA